MLFITLRAVFVADFDTLGGAATCPTPWFCLTRTPEGKNAWCLAFLI